MHSEENKNRFNQCLYCLESTVHNSAKEHVIPDGLGGDIILPRNYCCKKCNDKIGALIEAKLIELFAMPRVLWNVR